MSREKGFEFLDSVGNVSLGSLVIKALIVGLFLAEALAAQVT